MFVIELAVPFLIFAPRRLRFVGCALLALLQAIIFLTGNYCFFNLLTLALCVLLLDDALLNRLTPQRWRQPNPAEPPQPSPAPDEKALGEITVPTEPPPQREDARHWPPWAIGSFAVIILLITIPQIVSMLTQTRISFLPSEIAENLVQNPLPA